MSVACLPAPLILTQQVLSGANSWDNKVRVAVDRFGHKSLHDWQKGVIEAWRDGKNSLVLSGTGSGKSLCFQLPSVMSDRPVVVISPLISLMRDQCAQLQEKGISACFLGSAQPDKEVEHLAMMGSFQLIYICPETAIRLGEPLKQLNVGGPGIGLLAVDEAHCVSKWGHDFRPKYRALKELFQHIQNGDKNAVPIMALTATATNRVRQDIVQTLGIDRAGQPKYHACINSFHRSNLHFAVHHSKTGQLKTLEKDLAQYLEIPTNNDFETAGEFQTAGSVYSPATGNVNTSKIGGITQFFKSNNEDGFVETTLKCPICNTKLRMPEGTSADLTVSLHLDSECNGASHASPGRSKQERDSACKARNDESSNQTEICISDSDDERPGAAAAFDDVEGGGEAMFDEGEDEGDGDGANSGDWGLQTMPQEEELAALALIEEELDLSDSTQQQTEAVEKRGGCTIIYAPTRELVESIASKLKRLGLPAAPYHAGLNAKHLQRVHHDFLSGAVTIVVATVAFGMGINKADVRNVIHYGWPQSLEQYFQEAGRAGRDGRPANCVLFVDMSVLPSLLPSKSDAEQTRYKVAALTAMFLYCVRGNTCRARQLLAYFGEGMDQEGCGSCDACTGGQAPTESFGEAGTLLNEIAAAGVPPAALELPGGGGAGAPGTWRSIAKGMRAKSDRPVSYWRGLARLLREKGYLVERGQPSARFAFVVDSPQISGRGMALLEHWRRSRGVAATSPAGIQSRSLSLPTLPLGSSGSQRQGYQSARFSAAMSGLQRPRAAGLSRPKTAAAPTGSQDSSEAMSSCSGAVVEAKAAPSTDEAECSLMLRPEGDMLLPDERRKAGAGGESAWWDKEWRTAKVASMKGKGKGKGAGRKRKTGGRSKGRNGYGKRSKSY